MKKVKLPRDVADAIVSLKHSCGSRGILSGVLGSANTKPFLLLKEYIEPIGGFQVLLEVLVNGYEVEQTKEDKVREVISSFCNGAIVSEWVIEDIKKIYEGATD